jgi:uncharacterized protein YoxC
MTPNEIIWLVVAIFIILLIICLGWLIITLCNTLTKVNGTLDATQKHIDKLGDEPRDIIRNVNEISGDVLYKMKCLNPIFHSVSNLGECLECRTTPLRNKAFWSSMKEKVDLDREELTPTTEDKVADLVNWGLLGLKVWQQFKK